MAVPEVAACHGSTIATIVVLQHLPADDPTVPLLRERRFADVTAVFTMSGAWTMHHDGRRFPVDPSVVLFARGGTTYGCSHELGAGSERLFVTVHRDALARLLADHPDPEVAELVAEPLPRRRQLRQTPAIERIARELWTEAGSSLRADSLVLSLLLAIRREDAELALTRGKAVRQAERYLREHFHERIDLARLARVVHVSPFHLHRSFKQATGTTPHEYLLDLRLRRSRELLARTELAVVDIATSVGFRSSSHFANTFKRRFRTTPLEFRRQQRKDASASAQDPDQPLD
jgi:AraC-like DNA-binding protein